MGTATEGGRRRLEMLDGLRFVAAISVVAFHFTGRRSPGWGADQFVPAQLEPIGRWTVYGQLGVPLFFVVSGFVLLMTAWGRTVPSFVASRAGRLFPAYWVAVLFSAVLVLVLWPEEWPLLSGQAVSRSTALLNATMVQGAFGVPNVDGPYWTLWYEMRFYALVVALMLVGMTRARVLAFAALWPVVAAIASTSGSTLLSTVLMPDYACYFAGGMLLYLLYRDGHDLGTWLLVGLQCVIGVCRSVPGYKAEQAVDLSFGRSSVLLGIGILACFGLVALVTMSPLARMGSRWLTFLGALTYPLYLVHENLGWYTIHRLHTGWGPWPAVLVAVVLSLAAAVGIHLLVERPLGPRLRRVTAQMLARSVRSEAPATGPATAPSTAAPATPSASVAAPSAPPAAPVAPGPTATAGSVPPPSLPAGYPPRPSPAPAVPGHPLTPRRPARSHPADIAVRSRVPAQPPRGPASAVPAERP